MVINGLPAPTCLPATPPIGLDGDWAILIHLTGYQNWSPSSPDSSSGTSFEHGSSGPRYVPFDWARGLLDGRPGQRRHVQPRGCRPPASTMVRRDDRDDDSRGPRPRDEMSRSSRVQQLFPGCSSERSVRVCTRSPPTYRQAVLAEWEYTGRGRSMEHSPPHSGHVRDVLEHAMEEWERRRSRSPPRRVAAFQEPQMEMSGAQEQHLEWDFDPMALEAQQLLPPRCHHPMICYSPERDDDRVESPVYVPVSKVFAPTTLGSGDDILFGPGV